MPGDMARYKKTFVLATGRDSWNFLVFQREVREVADFVRTPPSHH